MCSQIDMAVYIVIPRIEFQSQGGHDGCYLDYHMKEREGISFESAIDHVKNMISGEWKKMNRECVARKFTQDVRMVSLNLARLG